MHFYRFVITACFAGASLFSLTGEETTSSAASSQTKIRMFRYEDARHVPSFHIRRTSERLRRIAEWCIPGESLSRQSRLVTWEQEKDPSLFRFRATGNDFKHTTHITVPADFQRWIHDPIRIRKLMAWVILARLGYGPELAETITGHWIIRGLAYKAICDSYEQAKFQFVRSYPVAWSLSARGIYPALDGILSTETEDIPPALRVWEAEYACLLLEACHRAGFLKEMLAAKLLTAAVSGTESDAHKAFFEETAKLTAFRKICGKNQMQANMPDDWFQNHVTRSVISSYTPMTSSYFETVYWKNSLCSWKDNNGALCTCRPADLPLRQKQIPHFDSVVTKLLAGLYFPGKVHPLIQEKLTNLRNRIAEGAHTPHPEDASMKIRTAEEEMIRTIQFLNQVEYALSDAQIRYVNPGPRMENMLLTAYGQAKEHAAFSGVSELLDKWDDYR